MLPAAVSLRKQGASNGATTAFLISTPESGVDSISITYALLDPIMTIARPLVAFVTATVAGITENFFGPNNQTTRITPDLSCPVDGCCDGQNCSPEEHRRHHSFREKFSAGMGFAIGDLWEDLAAWFLIGLVLAGLITVLIPPDMFSQYLGSGLPAMLMALAVVREKELGSITNLYATPTTRLEFLLGKQLPYIGLSMVNFFILVLMSLLIFGVPLKGSFFALTLGALLYVTATTGLGLLMSTFTKTQIAAIFATAIATMLPAIQFSGLVDPVSSLEGGAAVMGQLYPTTYFLVISRGIFTKDLGLIDLYPEFLALAAFIPVLTLLSLMLLKRQEQ